MNIASRKWVPPAVALALVLGLAYATAEHAPGAAQQAALAATFHLAQPLEVGDAPPKSRTVRQVHPSLARLSGWISSVGASAALADVDGDGLPNDLCLVDPRTDKVTLRIVPGTGQRYIPFSLEPTGLRYDGATMAPQGCLVGDLNEDGWTDVIVYYWGRSPVAFLRRSPTSSDDKTLSAAHFKPVELAAGNERWFTNSATMADLDGDGHVDLLFANYFADGADILNAQGSGIEQMHDTKSKSFNGGRKHFLLWKSAASGSDPSVAYAAADASLPPELDRGWTLAVSAADLDGDQLPELYLANDFGPDRLLHNLSTPGHLQFAALEGRRGLMTPKSAVLGRDSFKGMGVDIADINGDGQLDIFVSNIASAYALQESHMMWLNTGRREDIAAGRAPFAQASERLGLSRSGWGWDVKVADLNNDGVMEVIQATGFLKGQINRWPELQALATSNDQIMSNPALWPSFKPGADLSGHEPNALFAMGADGRYHDIAAAVGLGAPYVSRAVAVADVDGDGALDFVFGNQWEPSVYVHNECKDCGAFLGLRLLRSAGAVPGGVAVSDGRSAEPHLPPAIGAEAVARAADGRVFVAQVDGGNGHSGRRSPEVHFGLGKGRVGTETLKVHLRWRAANGQLREADIEVKPGWHTVILGA